MSLESKLKDAINIREREVARLNRDIAALHAALRILTSLPPPTKSPRVFRKRPNSRLNRFSETSQIGATIKLFREMKAQNTTPASLEYRSIVYRLQENGVNVRKPEVFVNRLYKYARAGRVFRLTPLAGVFTLRDEWYDADRFPLVQQDSLRVSEDDQPSD